MSAITAPTYHRTIDAAINKLPLSIREKARDILTGLELLDMTLLINEEGQGINHDLTPMVICCGYGHYAAVIWLTMLGANSTTTCKNGEFFPMGVAASHCHLQICKFLFVNGAQEDINKENQYGDTSLSMSFCNFEASPLPKLELSCWILLNGGGRLLSGNAVRVFRSTYGSDHLFWWVEKRIVFHHSFLMFIGGAGKQRTEQQKRGHQIPLQLIGCQPGIMQLIGEYSGVTFGKHLRLLNEFFEMTKQDLLHCDLMEAIVGGVEQLYEQ